MILAATYTALAHFLIDTIEYVYLIKAKNTKKIELFVTSGRRMGTVPSLAGFY